MKQLRERLSTRTGIYILVGISLFVGGITIGYYRAPEVSKVAGVINVTSPISTSPAEASSGTVKCTDAKGKDVPCTDTSLVKEQTVSIPGSSVADFNQFWRAWNMINDRYVPVKGKEATNQEKVWGAIAGLTQSLQDPYSFFLPPKEKTLFEQDVNGSFGGVGMQIGLKDNIATVIAPLKDSPAERAGILKGDKILIVDGATTSEMTLDSVLAKIRGKIGEKVHLVIRHPDATNNSNIDIVREEIQVPTIDTEKKDGVFIIHLYGFPQTGPKLFRNALKEFANSGTEKLIIDVRGNPGGYLEVAVDMASWFLPSGKTVVEERGRGAESQVYRSAGYDPFPSNFKIAMLIDGGSASAAEILAGALQQNGVATLIGTKSFGKGSVQELIPISPETSLKLTIARWIMPNGKTLSDGGIDPDIAVEISKDDVAKGRDPQLDRAILFMNTGK
ncbi:MAG TPA: S41 family peptidase [Candidatus Paceibacterota bacterium]|nr:S41 family peptidase [Candidatus Paceibacterota bacterium]